MRVMKEHKKLRLRNLKGKFFLEDLNEFEMKIAIMIIHTFCKAH